MAVTLRQELFDMLPGLTRVWAEAIVNRKLPPTDAVIRPLFTKDGWGGSMVFVLREKHDAPEGA